MAFRIDRGNLQPPKRLADGRIRVDAHITRTGVFSYLLPDGSTRREYRPSEEVFREDSLATFSMIPVTDDHPPAMLTAQTAKQYTVGVTGDQARQDGDYVHLPMMILDAATIKKMDGGKVQVSAGYDCECDEVPGVSPSGEHYDAVQRNIRANHVAIVTQGRAGAGAAVRMDGAGVQVLAETHNAPSAPDKGMEMEIKEALELAAKATARADAEGAKAQTLTAEAEKLRGERDALASALAKEETARKDAAESLEGRVRARVSLESRASGVLKVDLSKMDDRAIKIAVIKHLDSVDVVAEASDAYVDGRFDASIERAEAAGKALGEVREQGELARQDAAKGTEDTEQTARLAMVLRNRNQHKVEKN